MTLAHLGPLLGGLDGNPPIDPDDARRAADDILRDGAYAEPTQSLLDRAIEWIFEQMGSAFGTLPGGGPGTGIAWVVVVALVAAAIWLVVRALRVPRVGRDRGDDALEYGTETSRDATVWLDEADRLAATGDHRGALRCRHQALVAHLVTEQVVEDVAGRTAGEYRRAAATVLVDEADRLASVTDRFDGVWYGDQSVDAAAYATFVSECEAVEAAARRRDARVVST
ncbi:DUF4129 domain-containing protein [Actinospongicola halichondriae]|uniref:DUF4129 domain-containing protein n=1 Tax=Actinospongicola halichondriae TaxID=3236844 RepID=UPI003D423C8C